MKTIFIFAINKRWSGIARLPKALKHSGFNVIALCNEDSFLANTKYIDRLFTYNSNWEFQRLLKKIIRKHNIDLIIPGGDDEVIYLNQLLEKKSILKFFSPFYNKLIASSNIHEKYKILGNKSELLSFAKSLSIPTPNNQIIRSQEELIKELQNRSFPIVLKLDFGAAGTGVRICNNLEEAKKGFEELESQIVKLGLVGRIKDEFKKFMDFPLHTQEQNISVQDYLVGTPCMHGLFASKGKVLSSVTLLKIRCFPEKTGPSSVVQVINHHQIAQNVSQIISNTNYTGFASFDFIIDEQNNATLIECNPRPTPIAHISHFCGGNLCEAIKIHLGQENNINLYPEVKYPVIALFPNELKRDKESVYLKDFYHDIPFDDPSLLKYFNNDLIKYDIAPIVLDGKV
jgi:predicted ATP-grasp superfamily ATP-dependent carboligase